MKKEIIDGILVRIFGAIFGLGIALIGLILFFVGIVFCTTVIGIIVGIPMFFCAFAFVPGGIIGAFEMAIKGKAEFKFLDKFKQSRQIPKITAEKFSINNAKFVSLSPAVENYELN
jgi:hypothetical protein